MAIEPVAVENWAEAIHKAAKKADEVDVVLADAAALVEIYTRHRETASFLEGPQFRTQDKHQFVTRVFGGRLHRLLLSAVHLMVDKNRVDHLPSILRRLAERVDEERGFIRGNVYTAVALEDETRRLLQERLEAFSGLRFHFQFRVDPSLIGGVRVTYGDVLLDTTIRSQLNELRDLLRGVEVD